MKFELNTSFNNAIYDMGEQGHDDEKEYSDRFSGRSEFKT